MAQARKPLTGNSPALFGAWAGMAYGFVLFGYGLLKVLGDSELPTLLAIAIAFTGFVLSTISFFVMKRVRLAWSFASSISGVAALILLLAAPKIRDVMDIPLAQAVVPSLLFGAILLLLILGIEEF